MIDTLLQGPPGTKLLLTFDDFSIAADSNDGSADDHVEIRTNLKANMGLS